MFWPYFIMSYDHFGFTESVIYVLNYEQWSQ